MPFTKRAVIVSHCKAKIAIQHTCAIIYDVIHIYIFYCCGVLCVCVCAYTCLKRHRSHRPRCSYPHIPHRRILVHLIYFSFRIFFSSFFEYTQNGNAYNVILFVILLAKPKSWSICIIWVWWCNKYNIPTWHNTTQTLSYNNKMWYCEL